MTSLPIASHARWLTVGAVAVAVLCGAGMALQSRLNGGLGVELGSATAAALWSFGSGFLILVVVLAVMPSGRAGVVALVRALRSGALPWWGITGGLVGALFVFSQGLAAGLIGVALFTVSYVAGQSIGSVVIDRLGVAGMHPRHITWPRILGAVLALAAVVLASWGRIGEAGAPVWAYLLPFIAGVTVGWQQAVNGLVRHAAGSGLVATGVNFAVGAVVLGLAALVAVLVTGPPTGELQTPIFLLGGLVGIGFVLGMAVVVRRLGVLVLGLGTIAGQLAAAVALDAAFPAAGHPLQLTTILGSAVALTAVAIAAVPALFRRRAS